jgi:hypothetical protein
MARLADERKLVLAGPFGTTRHDPDLRGLFVLDTAGRATAAAWAASDPTVAAGVFVLEFHDLATSAPLLAALERDLARQAQAKAEGRTLAPGDGACGYVLLTCEHGDLAQRLLAPLAAGGGVLLLARLDRTRLLAVLDARDCAEARERFAAVLPRLGAHVLDDWFATSELARLGR